jgi:hypothetical protein
VNRCSNEYVHIGEKETVEYRNEHIVFKSAYAAPQTRQALPITKQDKRYPLPQTIQESCLCQMLRAGTFCIRNVPVLAGTLPAFL